jgi:hypothetical protein
MSEGGSTRYWTALRDLLKISASPLEYTVAVLPPGRGKDWYLTVGLMRAVTPA